MLLVMKRMTLMRESAAPSPLHPKASLSEGMVTEAAAPGTNLGRGVEKLLPPQKWDHIEVKSDFGQPSFSVESRLAE